MKQPTRFRGPSLILLGTVHILLFVANLVAAAALRHGSPYVNPFAAAETVRDFFQHDPTAVRVSSALMFFSAVPLGILAVTMVSRLRYMGVRAAGTNIALFGGLTAANAVMFSGLLGWLLSVPEVAASVPVVRAVYFLSFLFGGATYAVGFGLLAAGVSVTSFFSGLLPPWQAALGMVVAIAGEFSAFSLIAYPANFLIPITRYLGFIWLLIVAVKLANGNGAIRVANAGEAS